MTRQIGSRFWINETLYEVVKEDSHDGCIGCAFSLNNMCLEDKIKNKIGYCYSINRDDQNGVIFKEVE